jgi:hypothetical protein
VKTRVSPDKVESLRATTEAQTIAESDLNQAQVLLKKYDQELASCIYELEQLEDLQPEVPSAKQTSKEFDSAFRRFDAGMIPKLENHAESKVDFFVRLQLFRKTILHECSHFSNSQKLLLIMNASRYWEKIESPPATDLWISQLLSLQQRQYERNFDFETELNKVEEVLGFNTNGKLTMENEVYNLIFSKG